MSITSAKSGGTGISLALDNNYMEPIATTVVGSGGLSSSIVFTNIPSGYKHLQLRVHARNTRNAAGGDGPDMFLNGDLTATNYSQHYLYGNGTDAAASGSVNAGSIYAIRIATDGQTSNVFGESIIDILDYSNTNKYKTVRALTGFDNNGTGSVWLTSSAWLSTDAVSTITIGNYLYTWYQGSRFSLYGIKG